MSKVKSSGAYHQASLVSNWLAVLGPRLSPLLVLLFVVLGLGVSSITPTIPRRAALTVGTASPSSILAPKRVQYVSRLLTEAEQARAEAAVQPVYVTDPNIAREQLAKMREIVSYISSIRQDAHATPADKVRWISKIPDLALPDSVVSTTVALDDASWHRVTDEITFLLDRLLRDGVRDDQLAEVRSRVPSAVTYALSPDQSEIVSVFVNGLLKANSFFDERAWREKQKQARDNVEPVQHVIERGQAVVREGDIVTPLHLEELAALGLQSTAPQWQQISSSLLFVLALVGTLAFYVMRTRPVLLHQQRRLFLLGFLIVVTALSAKLTIPGHVLLPYMFPLPAVAMLMAVLLDTQLAIVVTALLSMYVGVIGGSLELASYVLIGSIVAALTVSRLERLGTFAWAACLIALVNAVVAGSFRLFFEGVDLVGLLQLVGASIVNGIISSSLTFATFYWLGSLAGITTPLQLLELARPTHPLTRRLLLEAPGTYHHSLLVGNLGERAADVVGADALLVRVGALHHDVGKVLRPYFFVENQVEGENYHQQLDPKTSAQILLGHVKDSIDLARKHRFPDAVIDIIAQHHGTTCVGYGYFYQQACKETPDVDVADFCYAGPRPQTKEAAIVMLADGVEAAVRASSPSSVGEIERTVRKIISDRLVSNELDECELTLHDLDNIRAAFVAVLQGVFHPRIQYVETSGMAYAEQKAT